MGCSDSVGYLDVTVWGRSGEACARHLSQGWLSGAAGRLEYREWATDDGTKRSAHAVTGSVDFLAAPKALGSEAAAA